MGTNNEQDVITTNDGSPTIQITDVPETIPWYKSTIIMSALLSALTKILVLSGIINAVSPEDINALSNVIVLIIGGVGDAFVIQQRIVQQASPTPTLKNQNKTKQG